jgi:hypothetical protein
LAAGKKFFSRGWEGRWGGVRNRRAGGRGGGPGFDAPAPRDRGRDGEAAGVLGGFDGQRRGRKPEGAGWGAVSGPGDGPGLGSAPTFREVVPGWAPGWCRNLWLSRGGSCWRFSGKWLGCGGGGGRSGGSGVLRATIRVWEARNRRGRGAGNRSHCTWRLWASGSGPGVALSDPCWALVGKEGWWGSGLRTTQRGLRKPGWPGGERGRCRRGPSTAGEEWA